MLNWTDETFNQIIKLREQKWSYSKIAKRMGTTKNSVMGKMYRHKIKNGYKPEVKQIGKERFKNGHPLYFKKIGTNICFICNKVYNIFSVHDRFCGACKRTSLYRNS